MIESKKKCLKMLKDTIAEVKKIKKERFISSVIIQFEEKTDSYRSDIQTNN